MSIGMLINISLISVEQPVVTCYIPAIGDLIILIMLFLIKIASTSKLDKHVSLLCSRGYSSLILDILETSHQNIWGCPSVG